ncbi:MAG: thiamine pyrophosphate-binding protein [Chloroflexi bacterium]|nr:thiamine pyrophosphate-binding protein [Chloroflexota bacterium]MCL5110910.1 thiamine pyrophosphate-binding protein [Chloroflexota bacterium]
MSEKNCWQAVVDSLEAEGVRYVFGLPGGPAHLYDALYDSKVVKPVLMRHETAGVFAALGHARVSGEPAVCFGSAGPGVANLVTGLLEAQSACTPVIALGVSSAMQHAGLGAFQETDQLALCKPVTKWSFRVTTPQRTPWAMRRAFSLTTNGQPGPVYVEFPGDVALRKAEMPAYRPAERWLRTAPDPDRLAAAAKLLAQAKRPVVVAGGGVVLSRAGAELLRLAERFSIPVMTTLSGRGAIPEEHPLSLGMVGLYFSPLGEQTYADADLLLIVGSRSEEFQSGAWKFFPAGAKMVQIDIAADEIGRNWLPDAPVVADARLALAALGERLMVDAAKRQAWQERARAIAGKKAAYETEVAAECRDEGVPLKSKRIAHELSEVFGPDTILVNENGGQDLWTYAHPYYQVRSGGLCVPPGEQTCMGFATGAAIGAKLAAPDKNVVCETGDGAFQFFNEEIASAKQAGAAVTFLVLNSFSLGWPKFGQKRLGNRFIATDFTVQPEFALLAKASGCYGEQVREPAEIRPALTRALGANRDGLPAVLEFIVDETELPYGFQSYYERTGR